MNIKEATRSFEAWLGKQVVLVRQDLAQKHRNMAADPFTFLRATFYRWAQIWPSVCSELAAAPEVLAVGDLHIENFGTWRDAEGRLIWGINDFDEAHPLPYTNDLVRLATSANLAIWSSHMATNLRQVCEAILEGYGKGLEKGGKPFILEEKHAELRRMALNKLRDPVRYWGRLDALRTYKGPVPPEVIEALEGMMPAAGIRQRIVHRLAGEGSLGRQRFLALANWRGARIAREAKSMAPSACVWAKGTGASRILYSEILKRAVRCEDPFVQIRGRWLLRRLAPDCSRIPLPSLPSERDERALLRAMGRETANIHLGTADALAAIHRDFSRRKDSWLLDAAGAMTEAMGQDFDAWRRQSRA